MSGIDVLRADRLDGLGRTTPIRVRAAFVLGFESATSARELEPEFGPWLTQVEAHFVDDIKMAIADGSARNVDANRTGRLLLAAGTGGAYAALRSEDTATAAEAFNSVLELITNDPQTSAPMAAANALQTHYSDRVAKTTTLHIRVDEEDEQRIDAIQEEFGGRSEVMRLALAQFLASVERRKETREFINEWSRDMGGIDENEVAEMTAKYFS